MYQPVQPNSTVIVLGLWPQLKELVRYKVIKYIEEIFEDFIVGFYHLEIGLVPCRSAPFSDVETVPSRSCIWCPTLQGHISAVIDSF